MSYAYDFSSQYAQIFAGKITARAHQQYAEFKKALYTKPALFLNFADNHDTWNNGVTEDGLYRHERTNRLFAKAVFAACCFENGGLQAFGGFEESENNYASFAKKALAARRTLVPFFGESELSYSVYPSDENVYCIVRENGAHRMLVLVNFSENPTEFTAGGEAFALPGYGVRVYFDGALLLDEAD